jgi:serine/threonine protein kinase
MTERGKEPTMGDADKVTGNDADLGATRSLGKYTPFARLGRGGMADVFLAVARGPVGFNKLAVVKRLHRSEDLEMFLDEARLAARLSQQNIVNTYEVGEAQGQYFIAMEYLDGQPLQAILTDWTARGARIDEGVAAFIAMQALKGLHYAHELADYDGTPLNVVHRDVSPHNLFVTYQGEVKLLDFGIAKAKLNSTQTETGVLKGKIRYMAPEQMVEKDIDRRADIFALGIVLWEMVTGSRLYGGNLTSVLARVTMEDAPPLRSVRADLSAELEAIVAKALQRDLDHRYATADEMRADLEKFLHGKQEEAHLALTGIVNDGFAVTRDAVRGRVKAFLTQFSASGAQPAATSSGELPALFGETGEPGSGSGGSSDPNSSLKPLANTKSGVAITMPGLQEAASAPRKARAAVWVGGALAAAAVLGVLAFGGHGQKSAAPPTVAAAAAAPAHETPATGTVHLETSPAGALVEWRGTPLGRTPLDAVVGTGVQTLRISYEGYDAQDLTVEVQPDAPLVRAVALREKPQADPVAAIAGAPPASQHASSRPSLRRAARPATPASPPPAADAPAPAAAPPAPAIAAPRAKIRVVDDNDTP